MNVDEVVAAFALPDAPTRPTRIHKVDLIDAAAPGASDRKLIDAALERLDWLATLSPTTIGVASTTTTPAIQLLALVTRTVPTARLLLLIHRAIPVPAVLITSFGGTVRISLATLRPAERVDASVVERLVTTPPIGMEDAKWGAFLATLAVPNLPRTDLAALYEALVWRVEALEAATKSGCPFRLPSDRDEAILRREALAEHDVVAAEYARARAAARAEKSLARQVALADAAAVVKERLDAIMLKMA